jgi:hypothetical protein
MTNSIDRRDLLASTVTAWAAVVIGCSDDSSGGGTGGTGGAMGGTGGTMAGAGGTVGGTGGTSAGMSAAGTGAAGMPAAGTGGNAAGAGSGAGGAGQSGAGASSAGAGAGGMSGAGAGGMNGGMAGGGAGGMSGGDAGTGGTSFTCTSDTSNGDHSHPLTVPGGDVERGYQDAPYPLEDGGTGHMHELTLTSYDFVYLAAGAMAIRESTMTNMHTHMCKIACAIG